MTGISAYFIEQGMIEERAKCMYHLMVKQNLTFEAAAEILGISKDDWNACWEKMKKLRFEKQ